MSDTGLASVPELNSQVENITGTGLGDQAPLQETIGMFVEDLLGKYLSYQ